VSKIIGLVIYTITLVGMSLKHLLESFKGEKLDIVSKPFLELASSNF
jgi:hypothetical protein